MRPLLAIFSVLICLAATFADELPVIKDVDAYVPDGFRIFDHRQVVSMCWNQTEQETENSK